MCIIAKHHKLPFLRSLSRAEQCFELIYIDLRGPYKSKTLLAASYFLTILDDHSRSTCTLLLHNKMQAKNTIFSFFSQVETQFQSIIKTIRTDNGTEIIQQECLSFFMTKGVIHQTSIVQRPQQNGRVERKHRHFFEVAWALKFHANVPIHFWGDCLLTATHIPY